MTNETHGGSITVRLSKATTARSRMLGPRPWEKERDSFRINPDGTITVTREYASRLLAQNNPGIGGSRRDYESIKRAVLAHDRADALRLGASERDAAVVAGHFVEPWAHSALNERQRALITALEPHD